MSEKIISGQYNYCQHKFFSPGHQYLYNNTIKRKKIRINKTYDPFIKQINQHLCIKLMKKVLHP